MNGYGRIRRMTGRNATAYNSTLPRRRAGSHQANHPPRSQTLPLGHTPGHQAASGGL